MAFLVSIVTTHYYIYSPLKYKDDGRDVVSFIDFITIHGTFPSINAWISYNLYYYLAITVTTICDTDYFDNITSDYCEDYTNSKDLREKYLYFYPALMTPSLIAMGLLFVETSINVTYYKDCVFALTSFCIFIGMFWVNHKAKSPHSNLLNPEKDDESYDYSDDNDMISQIFYRQMEDTQKYDKVKIEKEGEKICAW